MLNCGKQNWELTETSLYEIITYVKDMEGYFQHSILFNKVYFNHCAGPIRPS